MAKGDNQCRDLAGERFYRLRRKLLPLHLDLRRVDLNQRRKSRYNDEEAWEGEAVEDATGKHRTVFSWQTVTDLLRRGRLTMAVERDQPHRIEIYREDM